MNLYIYVPGSTSIQKGWSPVLFIYSALPAVGFVSNSHNTPVCPGVYTQYHIEKFNEPILEELQRGTGWHDCLGLNGR